MPITFDNFAKGSSKGAALQFNFTLTTNAVLVVFTAGDGASASAVAYAGVAMTKYGGLGNNQSNAWILSAPASGSNVLSAQWVGTTSNNIMIGVSYVGVKAVNGFGTIKSQTVASAATVNLSVSSSSTDIVVGMFAINGNQTVTINNGNTRASATSSSFLRMVVMDITGATITSISATASTATPWDMFGIPLLFSASAATFIQSLAMMGCGQ